MCLHDAVNTVLASPFISKQNSSSAGERDLFYLRGNSIWMLVGSFWENNLSSCWKCSSVLKNLSKQCVSAYTKNLFFWYLSPKLNSSRCLIFQFCILLSKLLWSSVTLPLNLLLPFCVQIFPSPCSVVPPWIRCCFEGHWARSILFFFSLGYWDYE